MTAGNIQIYKNWDTETSNNVDLSFDPSLDQPGQPQQANK